MPLQISVESLQFGTGACLDPWYGLMREGEEGKGGGGKGELLHQCTRSKGPLKNNDPPERKKWQ